MLSFAAALPKCLFSAIVTKVRSCESVGLYSLLAMPMTLHHPIRSDVELRVRVWQNNILVRCADAHTDSIVVLGVKVTSVLYLQ
ncbi:Uncharacterised protein [Chlamydia trachomatis]|nr:Uncharacterised protein [Chlamydia trachomatis]